MKKITFSIFCFGSLLAFAQQGNVSISKDQSHRPNDKAILDVKSTDTGVLFPRLSTSQRDAIAPGALENGLLIYNTDEKCFNYYSIKASAWKSICGTSTPPNALTQSSTNITPEK